MESSKAQVTVFIILMLMILIIFGMLFFVSINSKQKESEQQRVQMTDELISRTAIEQGMKYCIDEAATEGLALLGRQGGFFYNNQTYESFYGNITVGTALDPKSDKFILYNGHYSPIYISRPELIDPGSKTDAWFQSNMPGAFLTSPYYPCSARKKEGINIGGVGTTAFNPRYQVTLDNPGDLDCSNSQDVLNTSFQSFSKRELFPKLCARNDTYCSCNVDCNQTIQARLERFVEEYFKKCTNNLTFSGFNISVDNVSIRSYFTLSSVDVEARPNVQVVSFDDVINYDVSAIRAERIALDFLGLFQTLWDGFHLHTGNDVNYPYFNLLDHIKDNHPTASVKQNLVNLHGENYHLAEIVFENSFSSLKGQPFTFNFARQNRFPILRTAPARTILAADFDNLSGSLKWQTEICAADPDDEEVFIEIDPGIYEKIDFPASISNICKNFSFKIGTTPLNYDVDKTNQISIVARDLAGQADSYPYNRSDRWSWQVKIQS